MVRACQGAHFFLGEPADLPARRIEGRDARGRRVRQERIHVEGQGAVGVADLLVDVLGVEVAVALAEVLESAKLGVFDEVDEGVVGTLSVAGGEVAQVAGPRRNPGDMGGS